MPKVVAGIASTVRSGRWPVTAATGRGCAGWPDRRPGGKVEHSIDCIAQSFYYRFVTRLALEDRLPTLEELNAEVQH